MAQAGGPGGGSGTPESARPTIRADRREAVPEPAELAGDFPALEILELIGRGGMGCVYKARQRGLDRVVALKILPRHAATASFTERFAREARALARLSHPSIVTVYDFGEAGGAYYFVMEYVDGVNLRQLLRESQGRLERVEALRIVGAMCDALEYAHEEGIVHRDIKPENILLDRRGRVKIADFGLAKLLRENGGGRADLTLTSPDQLMGTLHYMAPEQTETPLAVDHRADIYSLGVVLYEMLTGELPLGRFPLPSEVGRGDPQLDRIVERTLAKDPSRRFQRASEIKTAVEAIGGAGAGAAAPSAVPAVPPVVPPAAAAAGTPGLDDPSGLVDLGAAVRQLRAPATVMFVAGLISILLYATVAVVQMFDAIFSLGPDSLGGLAIALAGTADSWIMILGSLKMKRLDSRGLGLAGCVASIIPFSPCFPIGIPAGIWGLLALNRPEIAAAFDIAAVQRRAPAAAGGTRAHR